MVTRLVFFFLVIGTLRCTAQVDTLNGVRTANSADLAVYFDSAVYKYVFMMGHYSEADSIWDLDSSRQVLEEIVTDNKFSKRAAFFAAEILFDHSDWRPEGDLKFRVAEIYAKALQENYTGIGNPWGIPDDTGDIGAHILCFGNVLVTEFKPLLKCDKPVRYEGSRTATMGNDGKFRVKDIAASYICAIRNLKFDAGQDQKGRDRQIRKIRRKI
ncbi:MAG: hypothetical protein L6Q81_17820 [Bacteroidia bacterium]|nr:hypothetical protein [Bacteroidia bacterium]